MRSHPISSVPVRFTLAASLGLGILVAACGGGTGAPPSSGGVTPTSAATAAAPSTEASMAPAGSPAPSSLTLIGVNLLPQASFDPATVQVACDESMLGGGTTPVTCDQVVEVASRIATTVSANPIKQVAVSRPADNPTAIQISFWVAAEEGEGDTAFTTVFDPANLTLTFPTEDPEAVFTPTT